MAKGIEKLELQNFRGATTSTILEFDPNKLIVMLFGENGTGKSTIIDAIDFVCNGSAGSIQRPSVRAKEHLPALGSKPQDVRVRLTCEGTTWQATFNGSSSEIDNQTPVPIAHILRRKQLLQFIETVESERYKEMQRFIDVSGVEQCEAALQEAIKQASQSSNSSTTRYDTAMQGLIELWREETVASTQGAATDEARAIEWAEKKSGRNITDLQSHLQVLAGHISALQRAEDALQKWHETKAQCALAYEREQSAQQKLNELALGTTDADLLTVLQAAKKWLKNHDAPEQCPLCDQNVLPQDFAARLENKLGALQKLREADEALRDAQSQMSLCRKNEVTAENAYQNAIAQLRSDFPNAPQYEDLETSPAQMTQTREALQKQRDTVQRDVTQFNSIRAQYRSVSENKAKAEEAVELEQKLKKALEIMRRERHRYTGEILENISSECNRLYSLIHPEEPLGDLNLQLNENKRASLQQKARFQNHQDIIPQAYFSEAHLDTLGFCLFLALAKHRSGENAIIVLDDVFTSVDAGHLRRIVDLLSAEAASFRQIIIATHYRNWRDQYRYYQTNRNSVELMELHHWSLQGGVRKSNSIYAMDELRQKLDGEPLDRQGLASLAGVLMEAALDHLALLYGCGLPRRADGNYTLGELSDAVGKVGKHLHIEHAPANGKSARVVTQTIPVKPTLDSISGLKFIRNQVGGHFNLSGGDICDADVKEFGQKSLQLLEVLACPECGVPATKPKDDFFKCPCGHTRLKPLKIS